LRRLGRIGGRVGSRSGWDLQALYGLEAGKQYFGQVGSLRVALHF
jgi:hypothetical protein